VNCYICGRLASARCRDCEEPICERVTGLHEGACPRCHAEYEISVAKSLYFDTAARETREDRWPNPRQYADYEIEHMPTRGEMLP
jgi:hypothetical protein